MEVWNLGHPPESIDHLYLGLITFNQIVPQKASPGALAVTRFWTSPEHSINLIGKSLSITCGLLALPEDRLNITAWRAQQGLENDYDDKGKSGGFWNFCLRRLLILYAGKWTNQNVFITFKASVIGVENKSPERVMLKEILLFRTRIMTLTKICFQIFMLVNVSITYWLWESMAQASNATGIQLSNNLRMLDKFLSTFFLNPKFLFRGSSETRKICQVDGGLG